MSEDALLPNRQWNQKQKPKKQPWSNVECFAFGGAIVRFAPLETSFHAANHTIPPPPSYEGYPLCTKDKNRSPFHGEKTLMIKWFLGGGVSNLPKRFCMVGTRHFASATNDWYSMWYCDYGRTWNIESTEKVEKRDFRAVGNGILWLTPCKLACERSLETGPNIVASVGDGRSW